MSLTLVDIHFWLFAYSWWQGYGEEVGVYYSTEVCSHMRFVIFNFPMSLLWKFL